MQGKGLRILFTCLICLLGLDTAVVCLAMMTRRKSDRTANQPGVAGMMLFMHSVSRHSRVSDVALRATDDLHANLHTQVSTEKLSGSASQQFFLCLNSTAL